ncbi:MAG: M23 family metallopeptidase [Oscillospiraceae bacterium]|jgi:murein DD-endopeptidase MepM/ murein hydrolase activator NlpD|nr:M23 family metallopeptidase [Oscillospiraceae bacterium]
MNIKLIRILFFCKIKYLILFFATVLACVAFVYFKGFSFTSNAEKIDKKIIKFVKFTPTFEAMNLAMKKDIESNGNINWIKILAYLGTKYAGDFKKFKPKDILDYIKKIENKESAEKIIQNQKLYNYYLEAYSAVLDGFLGKYKTKKEQKEKYGLITFSPIAKNFFFNHYDDFGAPRSFGYKRPHLGHDIMCSVATPVIAVESGIVEALGWNRYGGWRVGLRSKNKKRYWYYAHLMKNRPFNSEIHKGDEISAGQVIGYVGRTGYSAKENVNNIDKSHLHFGLQIIFDESQKEGKNEIWVDLYAITKLLEKNKSNVLRRKETKEFFQANELEILS